MKEIFVVNTSLKGILEKTWLTIKMVIKNVCKVFFSLYILLNNITEILIANVYHSISTISAEIKQYWNKTRKYEQIVCFYMVSFFFFKSLWDLFYY